MSRSCRVALCILFTVAPAGLAQQPILEVRLPGVGETLVQARLTEDGSLELPAEPLRELTGEDLGDAVYLSIASLQSRLGRGVDVAYDPQRALVQIRDPLGRLAASRARFDQLRAENISRPREFLLGGPYGSLTTDIGGGSLVEGGWNFGRAALGGAYSTESGYRWDVSVQPLDRVYVTFQDGERFDSRLGVRWAGGPTFVETSYAPATGDFRARAATSLGPWTFYAQDDGGAAITYTGPVQLTLGRTSDGFVTRVAYGRYPSPLSIPYVR